MGPNSSATGSTTESSWTALLNPWRLRDIALEQSTRAGPTRRFFCYEREIDNRVDQLDRHRL